MKDYSFVKMKKVKTICEFNEEDLDKAVNKEITIRDFNEAETIIKNEKIRIAMLTVPAQEAQNVAEKLVSFGIAGILTYAPTILYLPDEIRVEYLDPILSLQHITYYL